MSLEKEFIASECFLADDCGIGLRYNFVNQKHRCAMGNSSLDLFDGHMKPWIGVVIEIEKAI